MCNVRDLRERGKLKIYKLSPVLGSIRTVKNCDLWQHFKDLRLSFSIIRTSQPENKKQFFFRVAHSGSLQSIRSAFNIIST